MIVPRTSATTWPSAGTVPDELHAGEVIKVAMEVDGTTPMGELRRYAYGVWVLIDDVSDQQLVGGTISNEPKLPLTLGCGSRVWVPRSAIDSWTASLPE